MLDIMERLEAATARADSLNRERGGIEGELSAEQQRDAALIEIDAETQSLDEQRTALTGGLPADLVTLYEKLRAQHGGVGAAALRQRRCEGAGSSSTPSRSRASARPAPMRCCAAMSAGASSSVPANLGCNE